MLVYLVARLREKKGVVSDMRSNLTGRVVGQLHQHPDGQAFLPRARRDVFVREATTCIPAPRYQTRMITSYVVMLSLMNATLIVSTSAWRSGSGAAGAFRRSVAMVLPLSWQITNMAGGWRAASPRSSRTSAPCRTACARSRSSGRCPTRRARPSCRDAGRDPLREPALRLWPDALSRTWRGVARHRPAHASGERVGLVGPSGAGK